MEQFSLSIGYSMIYEPKILLVGLTRNSAAYIRNEFLFYKSLFKDDELLGVFLVESDSTDSTVQELHKLKTEFTGLFDFVSYGDLESRIPDRISRLRVCRNAYIKTIRTMEKNAAINLVIVADMDRINKSISRKSLNLVFEETSIQWDACFPNQSLLYYDLLALRAINWLSVDFSELSKRSVHIFVNKHNQESKISHYLKKEFIQQKILRRKMKHIPRSADWISVKAAFGGIGIYKVEMFLNHDYGNQEIGKRESEHVTLHREAILSGKKLYISPSLINHHISFHTLRKLIVLRMLRRFLQELGFIK